MDVLPTKLLKMCLPEVVTMIGNIANSSFSSRHFREKNETGADYAATEEIRARRNKLQQFSTSNEFIDRFENIGKAGFVKTAATSTKLAQLSPTAIRMSLWSHDRHDTRQGCGRHLSGNGERQIHGSSRLSLDVSAAFDTIHHDITQNWLLNDFGVGGDALAWIRSHLSDRFSFVKVGRAASDR